LSWLNRCDQFFRIQDTPAAGKVFLATFYMTGDVAQWYALLEHNQGTPSWDDFFRLANQRFGPPLRGNALGELIQLQCTSTVVEYQHKFLSLLGRCEGLGENHQVDIFTVGLRNLLKTDVELEHPDTLEEAMALEHAYEQRLAMPADPLPQESTSSCSTSGRPFPAKQLLLPTAPSTPGPHDEASDAAPSAPWLKRLTAAKMVAKREHNGCYNCCEPFSREHLKTCAMKGVYLLQLDDDTHRMTLIDVNPNISLNAITSLTATHTSQPVRIADQVVRALIDSGSTHSISTSVIARVHLDHLHQPSLHIKVANGDRVTSAGICHGVHIFIDSEEFVVVLLVIPLEGYDIVLGVQWLRTLGPILSDFDQGRMCCWLDDHRVQWLGLTTRRNITTVHTVAASDLMTLLLQEFEDVFATSTRLPPPRRHNHHIHLLPDTLPVRPYRYPQLVKDEL
jgi:hypothetical protein